MSFFRKMGFVQISLKKDLREVFTACFLIFSSAIFEALIFIVNFLVSAPRPSIFTSCVFISFSLKGGLSSSALSTTGPLTITAFFRGNRN